MPCLLIISINLSDIAKLKIKGFDYCRIISLICKTKAIKSLQNTGMWNIRKK